MLWGLPPSIAAAAIFIGRSWDYINDPLIGHISDRTRSKWGTQAAFPAVRGAALSRWPSSFCGCARLSRTRLLLAAYYALAYLIFDAAATFVYMPYYALTPELTQDYDERTQLTSYRMFFSILGSLIAFTVPLFIIGSFTPENTSRVLLMGDGVQRRQPGAVAADIFRHQRTHRIYGNETTQPAGIAAGGAQKSPVRVRRDHLPADLGFRRHPPDNAAVFRKVCGAKGGPERFDHGRRAGWIR